MYLKYEAACLIYTFANLSPPAFKEKMNNAETLQHFFVFLFQKRMAIFTSAHQDKTLLNNNQELTRMNDSNSKILTTK